MARYGILCDVDKCNGCYACFLACKDEYSGNDHLPYSAAQGEGQQWLRVVEIEHGTGSKVKVDYIPIMCQHCQEAPCLKAASPGAVYRRTDGIVVIDPVKAKGDKRIAYACPYGCVSWNEGLQLAQKCTLCVHMLEGGEKTTRCVEVCPTGALVFGDLDDPQSEIARLVKEKAVQLETFKPQYDTKPTVKYLHLPKPFLAGEVVYQDTDECASGVKVTLSFKDGGKIGETKTDFLGDFEFKGLQVPADYIVKIEAAGYKTVEIKTPIKGSKNLGEIFLMAENPAK